MTPSKLFAPLLLAALALLGRPSLATSHPAPFSYLDVRLEPETLGVALVVHVFDVAHDLGIEDSSRLLDAAVLESRRGELQELFAARLAIGGAPLSWSDIRPLPERQSILLAGRLAPAHGALPIKARMFPYDASHQTFVNVYEGGVLALQAILDSAKSSLDYYPGSTSGVAAVLSRFVPEGARHVVRSPDRWLCLTGLLLLGGGRRLVTRLLLAFVAADVITTTLIALNVAHPDARLTNPALALTVVYVGTDNLLVRGGRDTRPLIALAFGILHGFWFGGALTQMDLPRRALVWSLVSYDFGALLAETGIVLTLWYAMSLVGKHGCGPLWLAQAGSVVVIGGGVYLFVQRVFFPGGLL